MKCQITTWPLKIYNHKCVFQTTRTLIIYCLVNLDLPTVMNCFEKKRKKKATPEASETFGWLSEKVSEPAVNHFSASVKVPWKACELKESLILYSFTATFYVLCHVASLSLIGICTTYLEVFLASLFFFLGVIFGLYNTQVWGCDCDGSIGELDPWKVWWCCTIIWIRMSYNSI